MYSRNKIASIDKFYIWTFIIALVIFIYYTFESYYIGELSRFLNVSITDSSENIKSYLRLIITIVSLLFFHRKNSVTNLTFLGRILFVFSIYLLLSCLFLKDFNNPIHYLSTFTSSSLWIYIYIFFYTVKMRYDIDKYLPKFIITFYIISVALFLRNYTLNNAIGHSNWHYIESYYAVALIPALTMLKGKYKYIFLMVTVICSVIAAKRTGIITCLITIVLYIIMIGKKFSSKIKTIFIGSILLLGLYLTLNQFMAKDIDLIIERIQNIKEDDGSGRGEMYSKMYELITNNEDPSSFIFGKGYNEVINSTVSNGFSAHNEFIEVAYDYGIIGLALFMFVFIAVFNIYLSIKEYKINIILFLSLIIFSIFSFTSHTILYTTNIVFLCMIWGYFDARNKNNIQSRHT